MNGDWRKNLKQGSFRGVPFFIDGSQYQGGRRIQMNEYPSTGDADRDPYAEDLGRKSRAYTLDAYVLNNELLPASQKVGKAYADYFKWRDAFMKALETKGPGTLVHPFLGTQQVVVGIYNCIENFKQGGKAAFNVPFMEAGQLLQPAATTDTQGAVQGAVQGAATSAAAAVKSGFASKFSALSFPSWVGSAAQAKLLTLTSDLSSLQNIVTAPLSTAQQVEQQIGNLGSAAASLIAAPSALAAGILGAISALGTIVQEPIQALALYKNGLFSFGADDAPTTVALNAQIQQQTNGIAINTLVITSALISYAQSATAIPSQSTPGAASLSVGYDTSNAAISTLIDFLTTLDAVIPDLDDDSQAAMADLRTALVTDLQARAATLPALIRYTPKTTRPAIVIAYDIYGDATREQEICQRNQIADPGFVQGGRPLEVLNV